MENRTLPYFIVEAAKLAIREYFFPISWLYKKFKKKPKGLPWAVCLVLIKNNLILSVSRINDPTKIGLPGGKIEPGEDFAEAACRELHEETGIKVSPWSLRQIHSGIDAKDYMVITYYVEQAAHLGQEATQQPNEGVPKWVTWDELCNSHFGDYNKQVRESVRKMLGR